MCICKKNKRLINRLIKLKETKDVTYFAQTLILILSSATLTVSGAFTVTLNLGKTERKVREIIIY